MCFTLNQYTKLSDSRIKLDSNLIKSNSSLSYNGSNSFGEIIVSHEPLQITPDTLQNNINCIQQLQTNNNHNNNNGIEGYSPKTSPPLPSHYSSGTSTPPMSPKQPIVNGNSQIINTQNSYDTPQLNMDIDLFKYSIEEITFKFKKSIWINDDFDQNTFEFSNFNPLIENINNNQLQFSSDNTNTFDSSPYYPNILNGHDEIEIEEIDNNGKRTTTTNYHNIVNNSNSVIIDKYSELYKRNIEESRLTLPNSFRSVINNTFEHESIQNMKSPDVIGSNSGIGKLKKFKEHYDGSTVPKTTITDPIPVLEKKKRGRPIKAKPSICELCGTTFSPEWRRGPRSVVNICNACGLQFSKKSKKDKLFSNFREYLLNYIIMNDPKIKKQQHQHQQSNGNMGHMVLPPPSSCNPIFSLKSSNGSINNSGYLSSSTGSSSSCSSITLLMNQSMEIDQEDEIELLHLKSRNYQDLGIIDDICEEN
ncbi:putative GATA-binding transcription factor [Tieghemostelium lacteum]|uniref:Putative GATA-binding transcription factor n=1 Tax=Tieghemostelium lacteum TaxID=361077 RepID=A0A152A7T6_TIELA|nr:putative GATA-binding transcription factor [Tieghemostelium lacteum]|eukprot:KYR02299.1 putative GATA-binding transcription factor [Tieghemostelium lacteum]